MVLLDSGMRVSELANLTVSDVDANTGAIVIRHGKGGEQRVVRIGSTTQKVLWRYVTLHRRGNTDRLFLNRNGQPLKAHAIKLMVGKLGQDSWRIGCPRSPFKAYLCYQLPAYRWGYIHPKISTWSH